MTIIVTAVVAATVPVVVVVVVVVVTGICAKVSPEVVAAILPVMCLHAICRAAEIQITTKTLW